MTRATIRNPAAPLLERAVELSQQPGAVARESGAGSGGVATHEDLTTLADADGFTIHVMLWDVDEWGDPNSHWGDAVNF